MTTTDVAEVIHCMLTAKTIEINNLLGDNEYVTIFSDPTYIKGGTTAWIRVSIDMTYGGYSHSRVRVIFIYFRKHHVHIDNGEYNTHNDVIIEYENPELITLLIDHIMEWVMWHISRQRGVEYANG